MGVIVTILSGMARMGNSDSDSFTRIPVHVTKMNAVSRAQLTHQMLTLLQKYLYHHSQCSKTWDSKCLALIAQHVRAFGIDPEAGGSSPPQVETFSRISVSRAHLSYQMLT